jgi:hypothetical protein
MAAHLRDPSPPLTILALALALAMGAAGARGGDPVAAEALVAYAERESGGDLAHPAWLDAARELSRLRPWQPGYSQARARLAAIGRERRRVLR